MPSFQEQTIRLVGLFGEKMWPKQSDQLGHSAIPQVVAALRGFPKESREATEGLGCSVATHWEKKKLGGGFQHFLFSPRSFGNDPI